MNLVLGVDGGNTKTIALVAQPDGRIAGFARSGCGDIYGAGGPDGAFESMSAAVSGALAVAGATHRDVAAATFSLAGADWPEDFTYLQQELAHRDIAYRAGIVNDAIGALRAGSHDGTGVSLAVGTGTAVGARGLHGQSWHISFWLWEAHAGDLGRQVLRVLTRSCLGIDPPTSLASRLCEVLGACSVEDLLHRLTRRGGGELRMRQLTPALFEACAHGDPAAEQLVFHFGVTLGDYALAAARQVDLLEADYDLVLAGGVFRANSATLVNAIAQRAQAISPGARPVHARYEPVVGALFLALESNGITVNESLHAAMAPTLPPDSLYTTE